MNLLQKAKNYVSVEIKAFKCRNKLKSKKLFKIVLKSGNLKNIHEGKRIYILGTGPSIKSQNLIPLNKEITIALNEFYLHSDIDKIRPTYYLFTGYANHTDTIKYDVAVNWYRNFEKCIKRNNGISLLTIDDYDFLKNNNLFQDMNMEKYFLNYVVSSKKVNRYKFKKSYLNLFGDNAAINAIGIAMYMGAKEICLLGLDHDWILTFKDKKQNHFYDDSDSLVYKDHSSYFKRITLMDNLLLYIKIFGHYEALEKYARKYNIDIFNLTNGGLLDVFRTKNFEKHLNETQNQEIKS